MSTLVDWLARPTASRWADAAAGLALLLIGAAICLDRGRVGFMPVDQSITFDGAWRILSGQIPHRDFRVPGGLTPILFQALFFACFGVDWFVYCLHAAVFNGLFAALVYVLLRSLGGSRLLALAYGALSAVVFYPPFGVPYMDQHAFFFTFLYLLIGLRAAAAARTAKWLLWALVGPVVLLAAFSKQLPTAYGLGLLLCIWIWCEPRRAEAAGAALAGAAVAFLALAGTIEALGIGWSAVWADIVDLPRRAGASRFQTYLEPEGIRPDTGRVLEGWRYASCVLVPVASLSLLALALWGPWRGAIRARGAVLPGGLALGLFLIGLLFAWTTMNQAENALAYLFAALGCLHLALRALLQGDAAREPRAGAARRWGLALGAALLAVGAVDAWRFDVAVNRTRVVHDGVDARAPVPDDSGSMPRALAFMDWRPTKHGWATPREMAALVEFFETNDGNFFLIGDSTVLYGVAGRPSPNPALWFHPGLTVPVPGAPEFERYEASLLARLEARRVRFVVVEGPETWLRIRLAHFPRLRDLVRRRSTGSRRFGPFVVHTLSPALGDHAPSAG